MKKAPFSRIVWPFAFSQTISWATMFYSFPAMFSVWESDLGWSKSQISAAMTTALLLSAIFAPVAGRIIDRGYFVTLHVGGTAIGVISLLALSQANAYWQFFVAWSMIGIAMAGVLYEPCFAILTRTFDKRARTAITRVTLVAGLAGTVSFPAAHYLIGQYDWRVAIVIFALALAIIAMPLAWYASHVAQSHARQINVEKVDNPRAAMKIVRTATFWLLVISYIAFALDHSMILTHLLPLLDDRGVSQSFAVIAASFIGPMQVAGRIAMMSVEKYVSNVTVGAIALFALVVAGISIYFSTAWIGFIFIFVILQGAGNGVSSIVRPLLTAQLLGRKNFGLISGIMALPFIGGIAAGPLTSALIWEVGGYDSVLLFAIAITALGIVTLLMAAKTSSAANK